MTVNDTRFLAALPGTARQISERMFSCHRNVLTLIAKHRAALYIKGWRRGTVGPFTAIYALGNEPDAPKPVPLTSADKCRRYRRKLRAKHGENYGLVHAAQKKRVPGRQIIVDGQVVYQQ